MTTPNEESCNIEIGNRIQKIRMQKEITQEDLAKKLNLKQSYISQIENGDKTCRVPLLIEIARHLEVSCDTLCTGFEADDLLTTLSKYVRLKYDFCPCDDTIHKYPILEINAALLEYLYQILLSEHIHDLPDEARNAWQDNAKQQFYKEKKEQVCSFIPFPENQIVKDNTPPNRWNQFELLHMVNDNISKLFS